MKTERLYYRDSGLLDFSATVVAVDSVDAGTEVVLDRTAFYPTGGGQPNDTGWIEGAKVVDVLERDDAVIHVVAGSELIQPGQSVRGKVDPERRLDHIQQHTGQHILSAAFVSACGAETRSFHLGERSSTIDIDLTSPSDEQMRAAEDIANQIVFEDRPVAIHSLDEAEAARLPLRKESAVKGEIRVIEIEGFDWSPCGGTHAARSGQVGLIAIKSCERARGLTRVEFVCGRRALEDYRLANETAVAVARLFSAERDATPALVTRAIEENKSLKKRVRGLLEVALRVEADGLLASAESQREFKIVRFVFEDRDAEELRILCARIVEREPAVAILATTVGGAARLVFARSPRVDLDVSKLMAEACQVLGGRGGGKPDLAQGGGNAARLAEALDLVAGRLTES